LENQNTVSDRRPRILAIDDAPVNLRLLEAVLKDEFEVQIATSGPMGLAMAGASPPDLILLDVIMPEMDGYETCRRIKIDSRLAVIPVIFVTSLTESKDESVGLALGAADYITKPVNLKVALLRIRNLLERERLREEVEMHRNHLEKLVLSRTAELREAKDAAESANSTKSRFLAAVSHDLRQPLYAAQLFIDSLTSTLLDSRQLASAKKAQQALKAISNQLRLLLDLSRLEEDDVPINRQDTSTAELFDGLSDIYGAIAKQTNVRLLFHPTDLALHTDHNMLSRLLGNLIDNAIKFSPGGTVLVCVRPTKGGHRIQVRDSGRGIADIHHDAVFDDFYQIGNRERNPEAGYGLGLSIVSRISRLLGIQVRLASAVGKGSVFSFVMPN